MLFDNSKLLLHFNSLIEDLGKQLIGLNIQSICKFQSYLLLLWMTQFTS